MQHIEIPFAAAALLLVGEIACERGTDHSATSADTLQWGEVVRGLQLAASVDGTAGVIQCKIRNGLTRTMVGYYEGFPFGWWECVRLEVRDGTNWVRVLPAGIRVAAGLIGPSERVTLKVRVESNNTLRVLPVALMPAAGDIRPSKTKIKFLWPREVISQCGENRSLPEPLGPHGTTFVIPMSDYSWPACAMVDGPVEARVSLPDLDLALSRRSWNIGTLCSPVFVLDGSMVRSFVMRALPNHLPQGAKLDLSRN